MVFRWLLGQPETNQQQLDEWELHDEATDPDWSLVMLATHRGSDALDQLDTSAQVSDTSVPVSRDDAPLELQPLQQLSSQQLCHVQLDASTANAMATPPKSYAEAARSVPPTDSPGAYRPPLKARVPPACATLCANRQAKKSPEMMSRKKARQDLARWTDVAYAFR